VAALALAGCRSEAAAAIPEAGAHDVRGGRAGVAVVELFTSEGCSSCPPADAVLAELARDQPAACVLAFHVDYWNELGWPDRFSSPDFTARQRAYARSFGAGGLFTPQMIVNGTDSVNALDRLRADEIVARSLASAAMVPLHIRARAADGRTIAVDYEVLGPPPGAVLDVAAVEPTTTTSVAAGENAGKTLHHTNVVRAFQMLPMPHGSGSTQVPLPASLRPTDVEVIAYVQAPARGGGMPVLACARATPRP
jgi:hypothetical protein